ncbi:hypothetical protein QE152_g35979 [Popillia japonica]|uniref:PHD-type domain-containing protein n=1 Tax=Popillia japonica TaxID=7064 RepID=A0AAW1IEB7_POPJA
MAIKCMSCDKPISRYEDYIGCYIKYIKMAIKCMSCDKPISRYEDYIGCRSKCQGNYHIGCVELSDAVFTRMKEDGSVRQWACPKCLDATVLLGKNTQDGGKLETYIHEQITKAIDKIVNITLSRFNTEFERLRTENKQLLQEIKELKIVVTRKLLQEIKELKIVVTRNSNTKSFEAQSKHDPRSHKQSVVNKQRLEKLYPRSHKQSVVNKQRLEKLSQITDLKVVTKETENSHTNTDTDLEQSQKTIATGNTNTRYSDVLKRNYDQKDCLQTEQIDVVNVAENNASEYTTVKRRRWTSKLNVTYGTAVNTKLKGVTRFAHLHVYGLEPNTMENDIIKYVTSKGIEKVKAEKLNSKHPDEYASYKISIPFEKLDEAKKPEMWPSGVRVNRMSTHRIRYPYLLKSLMRQRNRKCGLLECG